MFKSTTDLKKKRSSPSATHSATKSTSELKNRKPADVVESKNQRLKNAATQTFQFQQNTKGYSGVGY